MKSLSTLEINLDSVKKGLRLYIDPRKPDSLYDAEDTAVDNNEARFQLIEGCFYDYAFSDPSYLFGIASEQIVLPHTRNNHTGTLSTNIFVGTLSLPIVKRGYEEEQANIDFEVQSVKTGYRDDYRDMLEFITEKCTDLLLQANSPVSHHFEVDHVKNSQTLYQKFAFINSVIGTEDFSAAIRKIITGPVTKWTDISEDRDIRQARRFSNSNVKELLVSSRRAKLPDIHYLRGYGLKTLPKRISSLRKTDSVDTVENRFVKHALETFLKFCTDISTSANTGSRTAKESLILISKLEKHLHHAVFKEISKPTTLKLNSPVLQRKEGYREVLRVWLMFDLAAKLIWTGGDDIYSGGKKDIATLYEYWLFFKLLDLFQNIFSIEPKDISELIKETPDGLNLQIKQGKFTALRGIFDSKNRKFNVRFNYNRSFSGENKYPNSGSWTTTLRPDYTLSIWPFAISESEAEKQELIVHIHFDSKYKIANMTEFIKYYSGIELDREKEQNRKGIYKNVDLLKMHAYKDAIRRTGGAYVLYPGDKSIVHKGFHEVIPGLGAFSVHPSKMDSGIGELRSFVIEIIEHLVNRASQREKLAYQTFDIFRNPPKLGDEVFELLPEAYNTNRDLIPDDTYVLVGFYNSAKQYEWIKKNKLYNFRMGNGPGSLILDKETVSSKYLLLHTSGESESGNLWKIVSRGPKVFSRDDLIKKDYPIPSQDNYLVIELDHITDTEFSDVKWKFRNLSKYTTGRASAYPFTTNLTELMNNTR